MGTSIRSITKSYKSCQVNKKRRLQYGHLLPKDVITIPWKVLCVDCIGPFTLKGKDCTVIDFLALRMINPATSWFKIVELPLVRKIKIILVNSKESSVVEEIFNKSSDCIAQLVNRAWLNRCPQ